MQKSIRIKTANEALYIGRLLPKNPKKRKKRKNRSISLQDKNKKTILIAVWQKRPKQKKIYNKGKNIEKQEKQDKTWRKKQIIYG